MGGVCLVVLALLAPGAAWAANGRTCNPPTVDVTQLYNKNPREIRSELAPLLGAPLQETNQLPDGGTFGRLDWADTQDGVTQRYAWGAGNQGSVEVIFQRGKAQLVSFRLEEFETLAKGVVQGPCGMWPRDSLAQRVGVFSLPKKASSQKSQRNMTSNRFDLRLPNKPAWIVRMRCQGDFCVDVNVYFPGEGEAFRREEPVFAAVAPPPAAPVPAPTPVVVESPKKKRPLRSHR